MSGVPPTPLTTAVQNVQCNGWCAPVYIQLILIVLSFFGFIMRTVVSLKEKPNNITLSFIMYFLHLIVALLWTYLLYWLCANCHNTIAWVVLLSPILVGFLFLIIIVFAVFLHPTKNTQRK